MINDGYTEEHCGVQFRRLLAGDRERVIGLVREDRFSEVEAFLFQPPYVFTDRELSESDRQELFSRLMSYSNEQADLQNLIVGLQLYCQHPLLAVRDCGICRDWWFNEETGRIVRTGGKDRRRPEHAKVACETDAGCLKGHHQNQKSLSPRNVAAVNHFTEWEQVGCQHSDCPIVRRNWKWIGLSFRKYGHPALHEGVPGSSPGVFA